jgi:hypothetical protein
MSTKDLSKMGALADKWKKVKDMAEKLCKAKQKEGRKAEFPKFKSDFQKTLDLFESTYDLTVKLEKKLEEEKGKLKTAGIACEKIIDEYESAIEKAEVEGLKSKEEVKYPMLNTLSTIRKVIKART